MSVDPIQRPVFQEFLIDSRCAARNSRFRQRFFWTDIAVRRFLRGLEEYHQQLVVAERCDFGWLLPFRHDFRLVMRHRPTCGLSVFLHNTESDSPSYAVAIWLMGRCANRYENHDLESVLVADTRQARRHFARALFRLEAWPRLRQLAADYPDETFLATMGTMKHRRSLENRIARFAQHVDRSHEAEVTERSRMPLWFRDARWMLSPPKSAEWLRMMLARIKEWVRGVQ